MGLPSKAAAGAALVLAMTLPVDAAEGAVVPVIPHVFSRSLCGPVPPGWARCLSDVVTDGTGAPLATTQPAGYGPADLQSAYNLVNASRDGGSGHAIGVVAAYDNPTAESDLAVYRNLFKLPPCTSANGCFVKRDQGGGVSYPPPDTGWGGEIALDLDMASATCPNCKLILVEAASSSVSDLTAAVDRAAALGATEISNSYGSSEFEGELDANRSFNRPGIAMTAAAGDNGYSVEFPAASQYVTAVGGSSLVPADNARGWSETAWGGTGSGCSAYVPKPPRQADQGCGNRTVADVAAVSDPGTGVAVFHTDGSNPSASGWMVFGGTSAAAPLVAGIYAVKGHAASADPYSTLAPFVDVTSGTNGSCGSYLCQAGPGFDGPTGMGSPSGGGATVRPGPPTQSSGPGPGSGRRGPSASSASSPPTLTKKKAALYARRALARAYGARFKRGRKLSVSCRRRDRVTMACRVSWRSGPAGYSGTVTVQNGVNARGRVVPRVTPKVRKAR